MSVDPTYMHTTPPTTANQPALRVWLVEDDASIRWVLERALRASGMVPRAFDSAEPALAALRNDAPDVLLTDIRMPGSSGIDLLREVRVGASDAAGHRHDRALGSAERRVRLRRRRVRIPAQAVRHRPGRGAGAARRPDRAPRRRSADADARDPGVVRQGAGDAAGVPRHRPPVALQRGGADHRRVRHRQGAGGARAARAQPAAGQALRGAEHLGDSRRAARVGIVRTREGLVHRRRHAAPRPLRAGQRRHAVPRRNRRHVDAVADAPAARARGRRVLSRRRPDAGQGGRARDRRDAPEPRRARRARHLPRRPLSPPERDPHRAAAAALAHRGRSRPARALPAPGGQRSSAPKPRRWRRSRSSACRHIAGRATCASW